VYNLISLGEDKLVREDSIFSPLSIESFAHMLNVVQEGHLFGLLLLFYL